MPVDEATQSEFAAGSSQAIRTVYAVYNKQVLTVTMSMLGNRALAEEAVQQTFLNAWRRAGSYDPTRSLGPWLYSIARRASVDVYRKEHRHRKVNADHDMADEQGPMMEGTWEAWQLRTALERLRPEDRDTLRAVYFDDLSHEETARRLGITLGTVKSRVHRAQKRLTELLTHLDRR